MDVAEGFDSMEWVEFWHGGSADRSTSKKLGSN